MPSRAASNALGLIGAVLGGAIGYAAFLWIARQGFLAAVLPGALVGLGCGMMARHPSTARGAVCALGAAGLGPFCEWRRAPFVADDRLSYFATHLHHLPPITLLMFALGVVVAFWWGRDARIGGLGPPA